MKCSQCLKMSSGGKAKKGRKMSRIEIIPENAEYEEHIRSIGDETPSDDTGELEENSTRKIKRSSSTAIPDASSKEQSKEQSEQTEATVNPYAKNERKKMSESWKYLVQYTENGEKWARCTLCQTPIKRDKPCSTTQLNRHVNKCKLAHGLTRQTQFQFKKSGNTSEWKLSRAASDNKDNNKNSKTIPNVQTLMPYLHHDIWFEILSWLSASYLYNIVSRVCHTWATIIRNPYFVDMHISRSRSCLFIRDRMEQSVEPRIVWLIDGVVGSSFTSNSYPGLMHSTYQGVSLFCYSDIGTFWVMNPVTMQFAELSRPDLAECISYSYSAIRDRRNGELKVVCACLQSECVFTWYVQRLGIENTWKKISTWKSGRLSCPGMSIGYFLVYVVASVSIVVLDVSDESIHPICCPVPVLVDRLPTYVQMGNELSCISHHSGRILIHVLKDFFAGNWSLYQILDYGCIHGQPPENHCFLGWIGNCDELLVRLCKLCKFREFGSCTVTSPSYCFGTHEWKYFAYNIKSKRITYLHTSLSIRDDVLVYTDSLLSWKTLQA